MSEYLRAIFWDIYWLFTRSFWKYALEPKGYPDVSWLRVIICRWRGHPHKVVWENNGYVPNMTCTNCGDDLG